MSNDPAISTEDDDEPLPSDGGKAMERKLATITKSEPKPAVRRQRKRGGHGDTQLTTASIADSYVKLCHDPFQDIYRWIAECKSRRRRPSPSSPRSRATAAT
jgi:hypothetical protein